MSTKNNIVIVTVFIIWILAFANLYSQPKDVNDLFSVKDNNSGMSSPELQSVLKDGLLLEINKAVLKDICDNRYFELSLSIPYKDGNSTTLNLKRFDVLSPDAVLEKRTAAGNEQVEWTNVAVSYTGNLEGSGNTFVAITFSNDEVSGLMDTQIDNYVLGELSNNIARGSGDYILYKESDLKKQDAMICGTDYEFSDIEIQKMQKDIMEQLNDASTPQLRIAKIAFDVDYHTYNYFGGSIPAITNHVISLISPASALFMKEVNVKLNLSYLRIWTTPDPYTGPGLVDVLYQLRDEWVAHQGSVQRTAVHLISTRTPNIGAGAFFNALCLNNFSYAFTNIRNQMQPLPTYSRDVEFVTHEIGHNFGPNHTHNCGWIGGPIDTCYAVEGGCYSGPVKPIVGTIMSYCHVYGSISFLQGFGPQPKALIRSRAESAACITNSTENIVVGYPNGMENLRKGFTTQIYWGTSLSSGNVNIEFSTNNGANWNAIANNIPATQRAYNWAIPETPLTSQAKIRILNSSNTSEGDTSDAAFNIITYLNPYNITLGIEGFWNGSAQVADTVRFLFRANSAPFNVMDSSVAFLNTSGNVVAGISNTAGGNYYIQVKHRNALETWSSAPMNFTSGVTTNFNFTTLQSRAFGGNQTLKSGRWCFYSGDLDHQGVIDLNDVVLTYNDASNFSLGYIDSDVNGDAIVDLNDVLTSFNNSNNFVSKITP